MDIIYKRFDEIAAAAFAELTEAQTEAEKEVVRGKMLDGVYFSQIVELRNNAAPEDRERVDQLTVFFCECATDETLIDRWALLA